jgi:Flagellar hook-length control protein FliK
VEPVVAVQTQLLRAQLPELVLRPGTSVVARVLSRGEAHGVLVIAGIPLSAQLPAAVGATGETLRLTVAEVTPERVTLQLDQAPPAAAPAPAEPPPQQRARVQVDDPPRTTRAGGEERSSVALSFSSPALGRVDLRLEVGGGRVKASVVTPAGRSYDLAEAAAGRLRDALLERTGLEPDVRVAPRREPLDVYA